MVSIMKPRNIKVIELEKKIDELEKKIENLSNRLNNGRDYLMCVLSKDLNDRETLHQFGFDGCGHDIW